MVYSALARSANRIVLCWPRIGHVELIGDSFRIAAIALALRISQLKLSGQSVRTLNIAAETHYQAADILSLFRAWILKSLTPRSRGFGQKGKVSPLVVIVVGS